MSEREALVKGALAASKPSGNRGWNVAPCPFCAGTLGNARRKCFGILVELGIYRCFRCGVKGRLGGYENTTSSAPQPKVEDVKFEPPEGFTPLTGDRSRSLAAAHAYLDKRGIPPETIAQAQLGACAFGYYIGRVVAPVLDVDEQTWLGFSARSWLPRGAVDAPYLYPQNMLKGQIMYNGKALYQEDNDMPLILVEGIFDALPLWPYAVAFLGKPSHFQEDLLVDCPRPVVSMLDGDAHSESQALVWRLQMRGKRAGWVRLPPSEDPGSLGRDWVLESARRAL